MKKIFYAGLTLIAAASAMPAAAQITTFNFSGGNSPTSGSAGNQRVFTNSNGTITVKVAAWSLNTATGTPVAAYLGHYDRGLGVTNSSGDSHTIDNVGRFDFVSLTFSTAVQLLNGTLNPYVVTGNTADNDPSVSFTYDKNMGSILQPIQMEDLQLHTTELLGNMNAPYSTNLNPGMNTGNIWTIGADRLLVNNVDLDDGFKLGGISVQLPVPEPASWAMMISGFGVAGGALRRRRLPQRTPSLA